MSTRRVYAGLFFVRRSNNNASDGATTYSVHSVGIRSFTDSMLERLDTEIDS